MKVNMIDDVCFPHRMIAGEEQQWHVQTKQRADSLRVKIYYETYAQPIYIAEGKLNYITLEPYHAKGGSGYFTPYHVGTYRVEILVWNRWFKQSTMRIEDAHLSHFDEIRPWQPPRKYP
jgi:hypothetical protein